MRNHKIEVIQNRGDYSEVHGSRNIHMDTIDDQINSPFSMTSPIDNRDTRPIQDGFIRSSTIDEGNLQDYMSFKSLSNRVMSANQSFGLTLHVPQREDHTDGIESPITTGSDRKRPWVVSEQYKMFANKNVEYHEIVKIYCDDLVSNPYEENLQNDIMIGKWLDGIIPKLSHELSILMLEASRFKVDSTVLDVYKNLLSLVGKRYAIQMKIEVIYDSLLGY